MRVAVCGAEASGKTTLCEGLGGRAGLTVLADLRLEILREFPYDTLFEVERLHPGTWDALVERQAQRELSAPDCVIDTPVLDLLGLWIRWGWNDATPDSADRLLSLAKECASRYTHVIVLPPVHVAPFEKRRFRHAGNALHMTTIIDSLLAQMAGGLPVLHLEAGSAEEMLAAAVSFVHS